MKKRIVTIVATAIILAFFGYGAWAVATAPTQTQSDSTITQTDQDDAPPNQSAMLVDGWDFGGVPVNIADPLRNCAANHTALNASHINVAQLHPCLKATFTVDLRVGLESSTVTYTSTFTPETAGYTAVLGNTVNNTGTDSINHTWVTVKYYTGNDDIFMGATRERTTGASSWSKWHAATSPEDNSPNAPYIDGHEYQIVICTYDSAHPDQDSSPSLPFQWSQVLPQVLTSR